MAVSPAVVERVRQLVGDETPPEHGVIDALMSRRYARAIGETDPLYFDEAHARASGYPGLVVPPNFLVSYMDWSDGGPEAELRRDGTPAHEMKWLPLEGLRLMGGGEEMTFHRPVIAGIEVIRTSRLDDVGTHDSQSGPMLVIRISQRFATAAGERLVTSIRTVLGR